MKLFRHDKPFLKGNLHTHTTMSDGYKTPAESMAAYRALGYDYLAITDHRRVTDPGAAPEGLTILSGIELDLMLKTQAVHLLGLGVTREIERRYSPDATPQELIDAIRDCGGLAMLCHPAWSLNTPELMAGLRGLSGVEVWNSVSTLPYNAIRADSSSLIDVAGSLGLTLPLLANDDTHFYDRELGCGFTVVQADEATAPAILEGLRSGRCYASQGPSFLQIELTGHELRIACSPVDTVVFYSPLVWAEQRAVTRPGQTEAVYRLAGDRAESFVRCQIIDAQGRSAWSPMFSLHS